MIETDTKTIVTIALIILIVIFIVLIIVQLSTATVEPFGFIARQRIWSKGSMKNNENEPQEETETYVPSRSTLINRKDGLKYLKQESKPSKTTDSQQEQFCKCKLSEQKKKDRKINDIDAIKDDKLKEVKQLETPLTETFVTTRVNNKFDILKGDARSSQAAQLTDPANIGMSDKIKTFMSKIK